MKSKHEGMDNKIKKMKVRIITPKKMEGMDDNINNN